MKQTLIVRKLTSQDIDAVVKLDQYKWKKGAALAQFIQARLKHCGETSWGCFDQHEQIYGTLFCMKKNRDNILACATWEEICDNGFGSSADPSAKHVFGISLTSKSSAATSLLKSELTLYCIKNKIISILIGSPIPGYAKWLAENKMGSLQEYVAINQRSLIDPQLKFYANHGYKKLICGKSNYFVHDKSLNNGVIIEKIITP